MTPPRSPRPLLYMRSALPDPEKRNHRSCATKCKNTFSMSPFLQRLASAEPRAPRGPLMSASAFACCQRRRPSSRAASAGPGPTWTDLGCSSASSSAAAERTALLAPTTSTTQPAIARHRWQRCVARAIARHRWNALGNALKFSRNMPERLDASKPTGLLLDGKYRWGWREVSSSW